MARWAISPIIGSGTGEDPYRPLAATYATSWFGWSAPGLNWYLVRATAGDLVAAEADSRITMFPDLAYTDVLTLAQRNWLINKCDALGQPSGWVTAGITFGQALRTVGRWAQNNFDVTWAGS